MQSISNKQYPYRIVIRHSGVRNEYFFLQKRRHNEIYLYVGKSHILKIGSDIHIQRERDNIQYLLKNQVPAAPIVFSGRLMGHSYMLEKKIGDSYFAKYFEVDTLKNSQVSFSLYQSYLNLIKSIFSKQLTYSKESGIDRSFMRVLNIDKLKREYEKEKKRIQEVEVKLKKVLNKLPQTATHGDLNPYNVFPKGIIDGEHVCLGPIGYDFVSSQIQHKIVPETNGIYEYSQEYRLNESFILDSIEYLFQMVPSLKQVINELILSRILWTAAQQGHTPKYQSWIFQMLSVAIDRYNKKKDLLPWLLHFHR